MRVKQREIEIPAKQVSDLGLEGLARSIGEELKDGETPIRFSVTMSDSDILRCDVGVVSGDRFHPKSIFELHKRRRESAERFNAVMLVPTGIGSSIGGHAGDATPVARLLAGVCDTLITHPNVLNASDINEMTSNTLYVEGSLIARLLLGQIGLRPVRANRVLVVIDAHPDERFSNDAINAVSAARASSGLSCPRVVKLDPPIEMMAEYSASGVAVGSVDRLEGLLDVLDRYRNEYDAVALASVIDVPVEYHTDYFQSGGDMINPWGGVEAMLTHTISTLYNVPSAHSPMLESIEVSNLEIGIVDPRMAAEAVSIAFLHCVLKGLHRAPGVVSPEMAGQQGVIGASDIACLVIPDKCIGLPTLAALWQGIPVIAVRENTNLMRNDLTRLPWNPGQLHIVDNYWEAAGVMLALREGVSPESVRRPLGATKVETFKAEG